MSKSTQERIRNLFIIAGVLFAVFVVYVICLLNIDRQAIGPENSVVGFASINGSFADAIGVNMMWRNISKILGVVAELFALFFALLGVAQLVQKKSLKKVDTDLYVLAGFYALMMIFYIFFEKVIINYRPVILDDGLEASFPSSHTMLGFCLMTTAILQFSSRIHDKLIKNIAIAVSLVIEAGIIIGRLLSGVHWLTDILGGLLLGTALVMLYYAATEYVKLRNRRRY